MKLIAHRGNLSGPEPARENQWDYIDAAIAAGFDVEIDLRRINGDFYLGHDGPEYLVDYVWLYDRSDKLWIHCKNIEAAQSLNYDIFNTFCHTSDPFCLVNNGFIWVHDLSLALNDRCIVPLMTLDDLTKFNRYNEVFAVCTDYPLYESL